MASPTAPTVPPSSPMIEPFTATLLVPWIFSAVAPLPDQPVKAIAFTVFWLTPATLKPSPTVAPAREPPSIRTSGRPEESTLPDPSMTTASVTVGSAVVGLISNSVVPGEKVIVSTPTPELESIIACRSVASLETV